MGFDKYADCYNIVHNSLFALKILCATPIHPDLPLAKPLAITDLFIISMYVPPPPPECHVIWIM